MPIHYNKDSRFLFIGDGTTEGGRPDDAEGLGRGYVRMIRDYLLARHSTTAPAVLNRGERDLRISDWLIRWPAEALSARADLVSILIDVPDPAKHSGDDAGASQLDEFRAVYRQLLLRTRQLAPRATLVLCEPAAIWSDVPVEADDRLRPYVHALHKIGEEFHVHGIVPVHSALVHARRSRPEVSWVSSDGQLPSPGHAVIAYTWLEEAGLAPLAMS